MPTLDGNFFTSTSKSMIGVNQLYMNAIHTLNTHHLHQHMITHGKAILALALNTLYITIITNLPKQLSWTLSLLTSKLTLKSLPTPVAVIPGPDLMGSRTVNNCSKCVQFAHTHDTLEGSNYTVRTSLEIPWMYCQEKSSLTDHIYQEIRDSNNHLSCTLTFTILAYSQVGISTEVCTAGTATHCIGYLNNQWW